MENNINNRKNKRYRIYHQDRYTNEIWYYETIWPNVSYEYLELYLNKNNKKFLYITNILWDSTNTKKAEQGKTQNSMPLGELREREDRISLKTI